MLDPARVMACLGIAAVGLASSGCGDGYVVRTHFSEVPHEGGLRIVATDVSDGVHAGHDAIRVEFDRPIDAASVGSRSVRVERPGGGRVRRVRVWSSRSLLFVAPPPDREFPAETELTLRIEGGGSPRSLRAEDGSLLRSAAGLRFRALKRRRTDLEGPRLIASLPAAGATDAAPASQLQLVFDEPLARGPVRSGDAVVVRVDGRETPSRQRLSPDLTRLVVRPKRHLPPGAVVTIEVQSALLDLSGNPAIPTMIRFRTGATRLRELTEDFVTTDMLDPAGTTGGWGAAESPGFLVPRAGRLRRSPVDGDTWSSVLPEMARVRFQATFPNAGDGGGVASALRLYLSGAVEGDVLPAALVEVGATSLLRVDPTFDANRGASALHPVMTSAEPLVVDSDDAGLGPHYVDVPFDLPHALHPGEPVLIDVDVTLPAGIRLAAAPDSSSLALVENLGVGVLLPAAELLVSGGPPQARSAWWDSGVERPGWRTAVVEGTSALDEDVVVEFQTAAATEDDLPDPDRASEWGLDLAELPALRFVRFRVTFARLGVRGNAPRIDRIVLPYQD